MTEFSSAVVEHSTSRIFFVAYTTASYLTLHLVVKEKCHSTREWNGGTKRTNIYSVLLQYTRAVSFSPCQKWAQMIMLRLGTHDPLPCIFYAETVGNSTTYASFTFHPNVLILTLQYIAQLDIFVITT